MRTLIIYHYIAHYRRPIFEELKCSETIKFDFASGSNVDFDIKVLHPNEFNYRVLSNKWLFNGKFLWQKGLFSILNKKYDHYIFLGNPYFLSTWFALILNKLRGQRSSIWTHGVTNDITGFKKLVFKILWRLSSKIFVYGNYAKKKMVAYGVKSDKIIVVYNSLDYKRQVTIRKKLTQNSTFQEYFQNNHPVVLFTGRLTKVKKLHQVLEAVKFLKNAGVQCNVVFVGDGPEKENLIRLAAKLGIESLCWFYGACYDESLIGDFYFNSRICVSPGNVGLTAMHSMVYGTPVITHSCFQDQMPEFEAIKDGVTGSFFTKNDVEDLASKIRFWLELQDSTYSNNSKEAMKIIDTLYNPINQRQIFENSLLT